MVNRIADAVAAYANVANTPAVPPASSAANPAMGGDFSSMLRNAVGEAIDISYKGEETAKMALAGKADIRDVVQAVTNAEMTLETIVAVRDKVINAYNEILRMPI